MKSLFEQMDGTYSQVGDHLLPDLALPAEKETQPLGKYGRTHLNFIKSHKRVFYTNLLTSGKLNTYLHEVDERATEQVHQIIESLAKADGTDETLKGSRPNALGRSYE